MADHDIPALELTPATATTVSPRPVKSRQPAWHPLLDSLTAEGRGLVGAHLKSVHHRRGALLAAAGQPLSVVQFVVDGLVTIVSRAPNGGSAETGLVGAGGLIGVSATLGAHSLALRDAVALAPTRTLTLDVAALEHILALFPDVRRALMGYANVRIDETTRLCVCATLHGVEQRIARWLLDATTLSGARALDITHAGIADLLGVRRASVTDALHFLEGEQALRCRRGQIEVRDAEALERLSCGCHQPFGRRRRAAAVQPTFSSASSTDSPRD